MTRHDLFIDAPERTNSNRVEIGNNSVRIIGKKAPIFLILVLLTIFSICLFLPLIALLFMISLGEGLHLVLLVVFAIFWGSGYFIGRSILWNLFGQEVFEVSESDITYYADYKYYRDGYQTVKRENVEIHPFDLDESPKENGILRLDDGTTTIETVLRIPLKQLEDLQNALQKGREDSNKTL